jgi:hypothetical protein
MNIFYVIVADIKIVENNTVLIKRMLDVITKEWENNASNFFFSLYLDLNN